MTYNEFLKKYGFAPAQSGAEPASVSGGKSSMSYSQLLRKHNVPDEGKLLQQQMRDTNYLTDTPVGNTKKYETKQTVSSDTLRAQLNEINARIDQYSKKAADAENEAWLASISNITHETPVRTAQQAEDRRQYSLSMVDLYKKQRDKVTAQLDEAVYSEYMDLANKGDFATRSQYKTTATGESENLKNGYVSSAFTDPVYDYINGNEEAEGFIALQESKTGAKALGFDKTKYSQMTADEVAVYNYLYSQSKEKADEFLKTMEKKLATRQGAAEAARIDAEPSAVKRGVAKTITAFQSGLDSSLQGLAQSMTDEVLPKSQLAYTGEAVKETTSGVGRFIYDSVELVSHMVPSILTSYAVSGAGGALATTAQGLKKAKTAGQLASSLITAVSAAGNSYAEQMEKGLTKLQSKTIAALIGASEGGLQYLLSGIGAMGGKLTNNIISNKIAGVGCGLARVGLKLVASGVSEAAEEVLQLYVEPAVIAAVTGDAYDAPTRAEVIYTALLSAFSAGIFEGGAIVADETNTRRAGNIVLAADSVQAVIDDAAYSDNPAMRRLADKLTKRLNEGKKITAYDLGRIVAESANPDALIQAPEETAETQTETAEIPSAVGETKSPTQAPERQTTPLQTETRTTVAEDGTTKVELPKVINREEQTRAAQKANDPYAGVPEYSPSGLKYTELERSGIAAGAAESVVETAKRISAITKRRILFYDGNKMTGDWARANGAYDNNTIYVNSRSANPVAQIIAHEMTHSIEGTGSYTSFGEYVLNYMEKQGNDLDAMRAAKRKLYGRTDAEFDVDAELVAEFVEKNLLTNEVEIAKMVRSQPSLGRAILNWINGMIAKLPGAKAAKERDFLIRARDMYSKALSEAQKRDNEVASEKNEAKGAPFALADIKTPTYDELVNKPDIEVVDIRSGDTRSFSEQRGDYKKEKVADMYSEPIINADTGEKIFVDYRAFRHSFSNDDAEKMAMAKQMKKLLETAVLTHSEPSKFAPNDMSTGVYTLLAAAFTDNGVQPVKIKVKEYYIGKQNVPRVVQNYIDKAGGVDTYAITYDGRVLILDDIEKEDASSSARPATDFSVAETYPSAPSTVSVKELMELVNSDYQKYLPKPVQTQTSASANEIAKEIKSTGSAQFSLRTWSEQGRAALETYLATQEANGDLSHEDCVDLIERLDEIYDVCQEFKGKYAVFSNWSDAEVVTDENGNPVMSVIVPNGDYPLNIDFSTICKKRKTLNNVLNALVKDGTLSKTKLGGVQIAKINTLLRNEGFEVACALCFVDSKRYGIDRWASSFANKWNGLIDSLGIDTTTRSHAGEGGAEVHNEADINWKHIDSILASEEGKPQHTELYKMAKLIKENPAQRQRLDKSDFMSSKGLDAVKTQNAELYRLLNQHGGVSKPKIAHSETQYISQIVDDTRFTPEAAHKVGGVRLQSFSDYMGAMFFDYVQMVGDLEAKKLPAHAYTKEQHFVKLFGMCGIKINMSLVPSGTGLDADGNYTWSNESFDFDTAVELQADPRYDKNVGTICVGINDKHIRTLLADERIRMVIPYHKSGINKRVATEAGISGWTDYTKEQSTRKQNDKGEWQKLTSKDFDFYADLDKTNDPRKTAENYVRWCEEKGYKPKFDKFAYETIDGVPVVDSNGKKVDSNYYKLLIDFAVYDSNGDYTPQQAVKLELPADYTTVLQESLDQAQIADDKTTNELSGVTEKVKKEILKISEPKFSISEDEAEEHRRVESFPKKSQKAINSNENRLLNGISELLSVPFAAKRDSLKGIVRQITDTYLENGMIPADKADELFETAYDKGIVVDDEYYNTYKHVKDYLRKTPVVLRAEYRSDMGDYEAFRKSAFGLLNLNKAATRGVDQVYMDLVEMAPELFPEDILHPADQLQRMYEVANGIRKVENTLDLAHGYNAKEFKEWAKGEFNAKLNDYVSDLNLSKRYAESREKQEQTEKPVLSVDDAMALYEKIKPLDRALTKIKSKHELTEDDLAQIDRLVAGFILPKHLNPETNNVRGIMEVYEVAVKREEIASQLREYKQSVKNARLTAAQQLVGTPTGDEWEDRKTGIGYSRETAERNTFKVVKDPEKAKLVNDTYFKPVHDHEKAAIDFKNKYRDKVRALNLSRKVNKGDLISESHAAQLIGEARDNIQYLRDAQRRARGRDVSNLQRDGKTLADWETVIENVWATNPGLNEEKINKAIEEFRVIYDELYKLMNDARVRNGYEPVSYRRGYFPHFQANDDGLLAAFGKALGISTDVVALPTSINGLTYMFKPGIKWFGHALERIGYETTYDAVQGFDRYIEGVADVIHHTDDIQNLRALSRWIRYSTGDDGMREQFDAIMANPDFDEETKDEKTKKLYADGRFALNKYVVWLEEYTNLLAGKKSRHDRDLEDALNRQIYNAAKNLESRVAANMISINIPSWLTNFIPLTQASALVSTKSLLKGMGATLKAYKSDDGIVSRSTFLTNRRGSDPLVQTWAQKTSAALGKGMEIIDSFTADSIVRARYYDNLKKGLSEDAAMSEADSFAASVMADRSKGATPTLFQQKNPVTKLFTQFQLEVNNQLSYLLKDIPRETREKGIAALAMALLKFMVGAWLYNEVYEFVIGRRPALDVLGIINDTVGDISGYELPNLVELGAGAIGGDVPSFETEKGKVAGGLVTNILEELPFTTILNLAGLDVDAGRYPIASALPNVSKIAKAFAEGVPANKRIQTLTKELGKPAAYILPPFGGGQVKRIIEAIATVSRGGSYTIDNEGNQILQYPLYRDNTYETLLATMGAAIFGKSTITTGREWVESGFKSLSAKDTAVYQALVELGENEEKSFEFIKELKTIEKTDDVSAADLKRKFLAETDFSDAAKCAVYYTLLATDKEIEALTPLLGDDKKMAEAVNAMLSVHTEGGNSKKMLDIATEAGVSYDVAAKLANEIAKLEPQSGKKSVTGLQKWRVAVDLAADEKEASALLKATMSDSQYERYESTVKQAKISSAMYIKGLELLSTYGSNPSNDEVTAAVQDMASNKAVLPAVGKASGNLTDEQRAILWQMWTGSTSVKNNPWANKNDKALKAAEKVAAENSK